MKKYLTLFLMTCLLSSMVFAAETNKATPIKALDKIAALVNDDVITQSYLNKQIRLVKHRIEASKLPMPSSKELRKQVLEGLINQSLQIQMAKKLGLEPNSKTIDKAVNEITNRNHVSLSELKKKVRNGGLSYKDYRKQISEEMMMQQLQQQEVGQSIKITDREIKDAQTNYTKETQNHREYHLQDILIGIPDEPSSIQVVEAKKRADILVAKINKGADFQQIAIEYSRGQEALHGGDLEWRTLAQLPTVFAKKIVSMKENQVLGPIRTPNGFHIIKLLGIRSPHGQNADFNKQQISELIYRRKLDEGLQNWVQKLRADSYIKIMK